jgi:hypothetical protein
MQDMRKTVVSQYASSPVLLAILDAIDDAIDPTADFDLFYKQIWNVDTAVGVGLDCWGRIVDVSRVLTLVIPPYNFGFYTDGGDDFAPFNQAPFVSDDVLTQNFTLTDDAYRTLILVKAAANISSCAVPVLNRLLTALFGAGGRCYVLDLGNMRMRYVFEFPLDPISMAILTGSGAVPKPAGVAVFYSIPTS